MSDDKIENYEGDIKDGKPHGNGTAVYANGDQYTGEWKNGLRDGRGACGYANGDRYEGEWKYDKPNGQGIKVYANADRYEGEWKQGSRNGNGTGYYANGDRYEGEWMFGEWHGFGTLVSADGGRQEGRWKYGEEFVDEGIDPKELIEQGEYDHALYLITDRDISDLWEEASYSAPSGFWQSRESIPPCDVGALLEYGIIEDEERAEELQNGAAPSEEEVVMYEEAWLDNRLQDPDADYTPVYGLAEINDPNGKSYFVLFFCIGYSFSGIEVSIGGIFESEEEALEYLDTNGRRG